MTAVHTSDGSVPPVLSAEAVTAGYGTGARSAPVLHDVSAAVPPGRTLGIVGESGSGKSTLAKVLVGALAPRRGTVRLDGADLGLMSRPERRAAAREIQLIPQDPYSSLDPRMSVERTLAEAIDPRGRLRPRTHRERIAELLESVALDASAATRLPHEFSGGQRQRIVIARALAVRPRVIIADEITSSLDISVQAEILDLLVGLQRRLDLSYVFITHDLAVAQQVCTDLDVLYLGRVVERGRNDLLANPDHPYSGLLRDSVPDPEGLPDPRLGGYADAAASAALANDAPDPADPPSGCVFHPRCPYGPRLLPERERCATESPPLLDSPVVAHRQTACHFPIGRDA